MGVISLEQLLPKHFFKPDDSFPIAAVSLEHKSAVMRVGFNRQAQGPIVFEGETPVVVRFRERTWEYRYPADSSEERRSRRWRLEIVVDAEQKHVRPQHFAVVAQSPYGNKSLQTAIFKMYSKKNRDEQAIRVASKLRDAEHPIEALERDPGTDDPWEAGARYVAGISHPNSFYEAAKNTTGDLVLGACPAFDDLVADLLKSDEIQHMLFQTAQNKITFWFSESVETPPVLYPEVIEDRCYWMGLSIAQALAGPSRSAEEWVGQPVAKLVRSIYCKHLNNRNRAVDRMKRREAESAAENPVE